MNIELSGQSGPWLTQGGHGRKKAGLPAFGRLKVAPGIRDARRRVVRPKRGVPDPFEILAVFVRC